MGDKAFYQQNTVNDIIGREPAWIVRSGIGLIFVIVIVLFITTWFIKYPDTITSKVTLQTNQAHAAQIAKTSGHLEKIFIQDGQQITKGQPLALIESGLNFDVLKRLEKLISSKNNAATFNPLENALKEISSNGQLGELQNYQNQLLTSLSNWLRLDKGELLQHLNRSTTALLAKYQKLTIELNQKKQTISERVALAKAQLNQIQILGNESLVAQHELINTKQNYLNLLAQLNDIRINIEQQQITMSELTQALAKQQISQQNDLQKERTHINEQRALLLSKIQAWKLKHLLISPISGTLSFNQAWKPHQFVNANDTLFTIIPKDQKMDGWMNVSSQGVGKIKPGQKVQIELVNYPAVEYGLFEGVVKSINSVPDKHGYLVKLALPNELTSSYGVELAGHAYLEGSARIITRPRRLLSRFTDKITYVFKDVDL